MAASAPKLEVLENADALARRAAEWLIGAAARAGGAFAIALAGGSTPRGLYTLLASLPYRTRFPWDRAHWFWSDERFVPHDDARSNFKMAYDSMLSRAPVAADHIHAVPTEGIAPERAAAEYDRALKSFYGADRFDPARPLFAANILGLGEDGHTASLFPESPVLHERAKWAAAVTAPDGTPRITLTLPALASSVEIAFLVSGENKRVPLKRLLGGDPAVPATHVRAHGVKRIFCDREAAGTFAR